jgi:hypothetical protein
MNTPKLLKLDNVDINTLLKIEKMIKDAMESDHFQDYPIEELDIVSLDILAEYANKNNILVALKSEHSNYHQGTIVELLNKNYLDKFLKLI